MSMSAFNPFDQMHRYIFASQCVCVCVCTWDLFNVFKPIFFFIWSNELSSVLCISIILKFFFFF